MTIESNEPPLPDKNARDKGKNKILSQEKEPATSGFSHFWAELTEQKKRSKERSAKIVETLDRFSKPLHKFAKPLTQTLRPYIAKLAIILFGRKKLFWPLFLLLIMVLLPWISQASLSKQAEAELKAYAQPMDPIKTGQLAMNFNQYLPPQLYADPDRIVLDEMTKNDNYTLAQQLTVNAGAESVDAPERQAPTYTLQKGETITQVAARFDLHVGTILQANNIKPEELKKVAPGSVLKIPSSDTDTSDGWLVAINKAEAEAKAKAQAEAEAAAKKKRAAQVARAADGDESDNSIATQLARRGSGYGSVTVIGTYYGQCLPWAREQTGIQIRGYAGDVQPTQSEPRVGGIALDRFFGHASVVVGVSGDTITVHEANFIRGKLTERVVSKAAIRGYVY